jgi:ectoine hydroxylase-related dioxygenase (phytanoyl-CoA dioxygenase family)
MPIALTESQMLLERFQRAGYVVIPECLQPEELRPIRERYDQLMAARIAEVHKTNPSPRHVEIKRILERDAVFEALMAWPRTFPLVREIIGEDVTLATGGEADYRPPHTPAYIGWHNDFNWMKNVPYPRQNFWVRCTYFLDDVTEESGPFTLLPGSHLAQRACPAEYNGPDGQPREIPDAARIIGKAGTCLINNTEIWHTNTPNRSARPRKLIMILYKHAWMRQWEDGYDITPEFAASQTLPLRRQLCGVGLWHRTDGKWDA